MKLNKVIHYGKDIDEQIALKEWPDIEKLIVKIVQYHETQLLPHYQKLEDYFNAETDILDVKKDDPSQPNNQLVNDYAGYITSVHAGYFIGSPVKYTADEAHKDEMEKIQTVLDLSDEPAHNLYIAAEAGHKGHAFELVYQNEKKETRFTKLDAKQVVMVYDDKIDPEPMFALRYYKSADIMTDEKEDKKYVELYTRSYIVHIELIKSKILGVPTVEENLFLEVPVIEYKNNEYRRGDFENVMSLINGYDSATSDEMNDIDYFSDAYLILKNLGGTDDEDIADMKKQRIIYIENDGDARFLTKDGNNQQTENMKKTLNENIHKFSHTPDLRDENFANNVSGVAMKFKLWGLEQQTTFKEAAFRKALMKRIKLITTIMNFKKAEGTSFDYTYIQPSFTRSLPQNWDEILKMVQGLQGVISDRKLLTYIPDVEDPDYELEQRKLDRDNQGFQVDPYQVTDLALTGEEETATATENLNGAQITSLLKIVDSVNNGGLSFESAVTLVTSTLGVTEENARKILNKTI